MYIHIYLYATYLLTDISKTYLIITRIQTLCQTIIFAFLFNFHFAKKANIKNIYIYAYIIHTYLYTYTVSIHLSIYNIYILLIYTVLYMKCYG